NLQLSPENKYALVTVDIDSLYTNLNISNCKYFCAKMFRENKQLLKFPIDFTPEQLSLLLDWCLDHHFIQFKGEIYFQKKGIAMGSSCSVSIANISVHNEMIHMFNQPEIQFKGRYIDDIFLIVNINKIRHLENWIKEACTHEYLTFTYVF